MNNDDDFDNSKVVKEVSAFYGLGACIGIECICDGVIECIEGGLKKEIDPEIILDELNKQLTMQREFYRKAIINLREYLDDDD